MSIFISAFVKYFLSQTLMFRIYSVLKKFTNRMLLEPRCTGLITKIRDPLCLNFFLVVSYLDYAGSSDPKSCSWENLAPHHSILIRNFSICQYFGTPCIFTWPQNVAVTKDWRSKFSRNNSKNLARHQVHCCTRLSVRKSLIEYNRIQLSWIERLWQNRLCWSNPAHPDIGNPLVGKV